MFHRDLKELIDVHCTYQMLITNMKITPSVEFNWWLKRLDSKLLYNNMEKNKKLPCHPLQDSD